MPISSAYSMVHVANTIDGVEVRGLWDGDDAVSVAPLTSSGTMLIGAKGDSLFSGSANRGATITIQLMHTSPTHRQLERLEVAQNTPGGLTNGFKVTVTDTSSGESGVADKCYIQDRPTRGYGNNATVRTWVIVTGEWEPAIPTN